MKKYLLLIAFSFALLSSVLSQDIVRIMGYNLLYYGSTTSFCTDENNNYQVKAGYLRTILEESQPDILVVTELSPNQYYANYILGSVLNTGGVTYYNVGTVTNESGSNLTNGIFYNSDLFSMHSQISIPTSRRDINAYRLRYRNSSEMVFLTILVGHLKAGNSNSDRIERAEMIESAMDYIESLGPHVNNFLFMGDLNMYTHTEPGFQLLINPENPDIAFYDPIDRLGDWNQNPSFSDIHSQSTRTENYNSCFVVGGMNSRFDFILVDEAILNGTHQVKYKQDSYVTMGQDGQRFGGSLIEPGNTTYPPDIINALYNMSDHLPVYADFYFGEINNITYHSGFSNGFKVTVENPAYEEIVFDIISKNPEMLSVSVYSILGKKVFEKNISFDKAYSGAIQSADFPSGMYIINFSGNNINYSYRIVKN